MDLYTKDEFISMVKESPAQSLEFLAGKLTELSDALRHSQSAPETQKIIDDLIFTKKYFLAEVIGNVRELSFIQSASLPDLIDIEQYDRLS